MAVSALFLAIALLCGCRDAAGDDVDVKDTASLDDRVDQLERALTGMDALLQRQDEEMSQLKVALRAQREVAHNQQIVIHQLQESLRLLHDSRDVNSPKETPGQRSGHTVANVKKRRKSIYVTHADKTNMTPAQQHDVMTRSDDAGPLEAVVNQISNRVTEMSADIQTLKNSNVQRDHSIQNAHTSTFVHWGSSQCSNGSQLVYSGVVGGSEYHQAGAATNYLCLTMSPVISDHSVPIYDGSLYGAEYETYDSHKDSDAVCAVCRASQPTTIMIPGTNVCSAGWHRQYSGYLMAGLPVHTAGSEFICVDSKLEGRPGSTSNDNGKLLYHVIAKCGSLPCLPYVDSKIVTCAVCSQ